MTTPPDELSPTIESLALSANSSTPGGAGSALPAALLEQLAQQIARFTGNALSTGVLGQIGRRPLHFRTVRDLDVRIASLLEFLEGVQGFSKKTITGLRTDCRAFRRYLGSAGLEMTFLCGEAEGQKRVIEGYVASLRARGMAHETVATYFRGLHTVFAWLGKREGTFNPFTLVARPRGGPGLPKAISREEIERVITILMNRQTDTILERLRDLAIVALLGLAGLRRGEVLALEVKDIDVATGEIIVRRGKGRNGGRDRAAQLTRQGRDIVEAYAAERKRLRRSHPEFITSLTGDTRIGEVTIRRLFRRIATAMHRPVSPHMLRHGFATLLDKAHVSSHVRMLALGHQSLEVLQRYTHTFDGDAKREIDRVALDIDTRSLRRVTVSLPKPELRKALLAPPHISPPG
jgi:integrase/recombinase XerD